MGSDGNRLHRRWAHLLAGRLEWPRVKTTTATGIELDGQLCRWTVSPHGAQSAGKRVESASPHVRRFMNSVLGEMQRATNRATVRPVPKPRPRPAPAIPAMALPCPLCNGGRGQMRGLRRGGRCHAAEAAQWQESHDD